ncbi:MAG TPA: hypothetical protein VK756_07330 [Solirubrobacteraceae bacterium]|nr:hypothetical protein [Solirubrobacteraceae bacterium]
MAVLGLGALGLSGLTAVAAAAPTVTARAAIVPIPKNPRSNGGPTWPGTGDILGAAAALELEGKVSGTEYGGFPSPVKQIKVFFPKGTKVSEKGFAKCSETILHQSGPAGCPLKSFASSPGEANGVVSFGGERVHEKVAVQAFFNSGGGLIFSIVGSTPVSLEEFATATYFNSPNGVVGTAEIPLIETVPGALAASAEQFKIKLGAAFKQGKKLVSFGTVPSTCHGHLTGKYEVTFYSGETVPGSVSVPCPKHKK